MMTGLEYTLRDLRFESDTAAMVAHREMRAKLDAAALEVLRAGGDWAEGPMESALPDDLFHAHVLHLTVPAGRVSPDWVPTQGWRVVRHADWVHMGKPGL